MNLDLHDKVMIAILVISLAICLGYSIVAEGAEEWHNCEFLVKEKYTMIAECPVGDIIFTVHYDDNSIHARNRFMRIKRIYPTGDMTCVRGELREAKTVTIIE